MKRRFFEILDEMHQADQEREIKALIVSKKYAGGQTTERRYQILMEVNELAYLQIMSGKRIPLLIAADKKEFDKLKNENRSAKK